VRLFLLRHAQSVWNRERRYQGWTDSALTDLGRSQAEAAGKALAAEPLVAVYASTLPRARDTAAAIAAPHGLPVHEDADFREMAFGAWEGRTLDEVRAEDPEDYRVWAETPELFTAPGGETLADVKLRVLAALGRLRAAHEGKSVCLVAHGLSARVLILEALGLPLSRVWAIHLASTGISELEFRPDWTALHRMNTLVHLDAVPAAR
jgi:broad specificity phosphatase PhoE